MITNHSGPIPKAPIPAVVTVGQGKMAVAGWYKRLTSLCTKLPTPCSGDRDRSPLQKTILDGKSDVSVTGSPFRAPMANGVFQSRRAKRLLFPEISTLPDPRRPENSPTGAGDDILAWPIKVWRLSRQR